jgi:hypothetical protein
MRDMSVLSFSLRPKPCDKVLDNRPIIRNDIVETDEFPSMIGFLKAANSSVV